MASSARHLFPLAFIVAVLAVTAPRADAWGGGRFFFSKTTRPQAAVESKKEVVDAATAVPNAAEPNSATAAFSRPSTGGNGGRGYGLYGRPEESFPPDYFHRGVHRNAEKLTTTTASAADQEAVPVGGRGERAEPLREDNGSSRGRPPWTSTEEVTVPVGGSRGGERAEPFVEDNGSGRGRPPWTNRNNVATTTRTEEIRGGGGERAEPFVEGSGRGRAPWRYGPDAEGGRPEEEEQSRRNYFGMSDTRLYQNGRYYYDVDAGRYGYGRESNPVRKRPEEFAGGRRGRYGNAAGYYQYGSGNEFGNGVMENQDGFQEEGQNGRYVP